jgi:hypothetical protein
MTARSVALATAFGLTLSTLSMGAPPAHAADEADAALRRGTRLLAEKKDEDARQELQRAYDLAPGAQTAAQLGTAEANLGRWVAAEVHLGEALAAERDPWVRRNRAVLEERLRRVREHLGTIAITGRPEGATVSVDGTALGALPLGRPVRWPAGAAELVATAPDHREERRQVKVEAGAVTAVELALEPDRPGAPPAPAPLAEAPAAPAPPPPPATPPARVIGWSLAGAGLVAATAGVLWARAQGPEARAGRTLAAFGVGLLVGGGLDVALSYRGGGDPESRRAMGLVLGGRF